MEEQRRYRLWVLLALVALIAGTFAVSVPATGAAAPAWQPGTAYAVGQLASYNGIDYRCIQAHTSQVGWEPPNVPALWTPAGSGPTNTPTRTNTPGPSPTPTRTSPPGPSATPTRTNTPAPTSPSGACTAPAWDRTAVYVGGNLVSHNNHQWRAKWWTQGEEPGTTGQFGVWEDLGPCAGTPTPTTALTNTPTRTNTPGPSPTPTRTPTAAPPVANRQIVAYYIQWGIYGRHFFVKDLETSAAADKITVVNYAFNNVRNNQCEVGVTQGGVGDAFADYGKGFQPSESVDGVGDVFNQPLKGNWNQLKKLKARHPQIKVLISLGGWTWSDGFYSAAQPANRAAFVASCIDHYIRGNLPVTSDGAGGPGAAAGLFDGIDIDWEFPGVCGNNPNCGASAADTANFTGLIQEFRRQLDAEGAASGKHYLLTFAASAGQDKSSKIQLATVAQSLDWINLMAYDFHGGWETSGPTEHHAPLFFDTANDPHRNDPALKNFYIDFTVNSYLNAGVPANKLTMGVPFYGRGWQGVPNVNNGLYQPATAPAACDSSVLPGCEAGVEDYEVIKNKGYPLFRDSVTQGVWVYNAAQGIFWSFDDPTSLTTKMTYIKNKGLLGTMIFELSGDTPAGELITAVANGLR